jgi:hypothetical protein
MKTSALLKFSLAGLLAFSLTFRTVALPPGTPQWAAGRVELADGDWLTGDLRYNPDLGLLELAIDGITQALPAQKVASFYFFDAEQARNRTFYVLPYGARGVPMYFEQVVSGRVGLLAREEVHRSSLLRWMIGRGSNEYYFLTPAGEIVPYRGHLRQVYRLLGDRRRDVAFFVERVKWFKHDEKPVAELVRYYNSLDTQTAALGE